MQLDLENIGIIKKASVKLDGLTVIAGENDTGKSTVGKVLYALIKSISNDKLYHINLNGNLNSYFNNQISKNGNIIFQDLDKKFEITIKNNNSIIDKYDEETCFLTVQEYNPSVIMIETPLVWNLMKVFSKLPMIEQKMDISLEYPEIMKDLHWNLSFKSKNEGIDIIPLISKIINGRFEQDNLGNYFFKKENENIELVNTATGIKYFGILQTLSKNNYLNKNLILILDEPEVHLHPKWQLKMAQLIVELVKNGVKVLVNSHSPYMIEALQRYSEKEKIEDKTNFYLAQNGIIEKIEDSNSKTLSEIFEKLSEPFDQFDKMDSEKLQNG
ncbi:MAG: AAA family ATPase [Campylobacterota bacterium]|nr:AAA family ATPase [Campylobacterota bacterium]